MSRVSARVMKQQGGGRIINIASIAGLVPLRLQCAFVAAKAGVVNLTRAMALELGPHGILVNGIAPGSTLTEGTKQLFYAEGGKFRDNVQRMLDQMTHSGHVTAEHFCNSRGRIDKSVDVFYLAVQFNNPHSNPDLSGLITFEPASAQARALSRLTHQILKPADPANPPIKSAKDILRALEIIQHGMKSPALAPA